MSGPVTTMPAIAGSWTALWRFAMNFGMTTRRLQAAMQRAGYQVLIVAGEPQVRPADVEAYMASSELQKAQPGPKQAQLAEIGRSTRTRAKNDAKVEFDPKTAERLNRQEKELAALRAKIDQLMAAQGGAA